MIAIDEEGGDVTRLEAGTGSSYPGNAALGVVDDVELTERVAASLGAELAAVGVNLDFAPVADVNTNPQNPVIGIRSFGSDPELVARHVAAFVRGLQRAGRRRLREALPRPRRHGRRLAPRAARRRRASSRTRSLPFRAAIEAGVQSIMTAHIVVRSLGDDARDDEPRDPSRPAARRARLRRARRHRRARDEGDQRDRRRGGGRRASDRAPVPTRSAWATTCSTSRS